MSAPPRRRTARARLYSQLASVSVSSVKKRRPALLARHFRPLEIRRLSARPAASVAGVLALKRAGVLLWRSMKSGRAATERDFVFAHARSGAVRLSACPAIGREAPAAVRRRVLVSLSHTRANAYGLLVYRGGAHA
jgi:phosphopantetheinyl transferase (holo-ACP synthase)